MSIAGSRPASGTDGAEVTRRDASIGAQTDLDDGIREAQRCVVEALGLDGSTLFERGAMVIWSAHTAGGGRNSRQPLVRVSVRERFPGMLAKLLAREVVTVSGIDELSDSVDRASFRRLGLKSIAVVPVSIGQEMVGAVSFEVTGSERPWPPDVLRRLRLSSTPVCRRDRPPHPATTSSDGRSPRSTAWANSCTRSTNAGRVEAATTLDTSEVGRSAAILQVQEQVRQVAETDATVLLLGETGSGKEVFASQIHQLSRRRGHAMVRVNCAAIPATLIESELFGREKGAYTGALSRQIGRFELANGSTIFLDEIGDLPSEVQVKLLRVLETRQVDRLGSSKATTIDTRIIAATHRDLEKRIEADKFREDLYYRLNVFPIRVPPLRERAEDIPLLVWRFVEEFGTAFGKRVESISKENMEALRRYPWPGNIRELRNLVERAMIAANGPRLTIALPQSSSPISRPSVKLADVEKEHIRTVLDSTRWRIRGTGGASEQLGLKATTLETRMAKLGLQRPRH